MKFLLWIPHVIADAFVPSLLPHMQYTLVQEHEHNSIIIIIYASANFNCKIREHQNLIANSCTRKACCYVICMCIRTHIFISLFNWVWIGSHWRSEKFKFNVTPVFLRSSIDNSPRRLFRSEAGNWTDLNTR